ncbi:leucyl/phenylalanyl-tRNA--protein transferase [Paraglaciecola marina]|uniref:leucyl/phenylalanyl-tRNA--protein transferase n=1 Tax=Paraglaciecola marina TaxID=2500157 RepID=UPI00105E7685|nr:leucyl/phenylalanyl-tRNA--protein transferase [Paraglaciecola marina]
MLTLTKLNSKLQFPNTDFALEDPNGLLAFGGDLSPKRLLLAYSQGIFPWFSQDEPIMWWSPNPRGVLPLDKFNCSKSLAKFARNCSYAVSVNKNFNEVIDACATTPRNDSGTWITQQMVNAYKLLHTEGHAHSIEVWDQQQNLVGGLYGVLVGKVFCGESMFHRATNASKLAFMNLVKLLQANQCNFIDCQMQNPHLESLGCIEVPRSEFLKLLEKDSKKRMHESEWIPRFLGTES